MATKTKVPSRNALWRMQGAIETALGNVDEYHFIATGRSTRYEWRGDRKRVTRDIEAEIRKVEMTTAKYLAALQLLREKMTTTEE